MVNPENKGIYRPNGLSWIECRKPNSSSVECFSEVRRLASAHLETFSSLLALTGGVGLVVASLWLGILNDKNSAAATSSEGPSITPQGCADIQPQETPPQVYIDRVQLMRIAEGLLRAQGAYQESFSFTKFMEERGYKIGPFQPRRTNNAFIADRHLSVYRHPSPALDAYSQPLEAIVGTIGAGQEFDSSGEIEVTDPNGFITHFSLVGSLVSEIPPCQGIPQAINLISIGRNIYQIEPGWAVTAVTTENNTVPFAHEKSPIP